MVPAFAAKPILALQTDDIDTVHQRVFAGIMQSVLVYVRTTVPPAFGSLVRTLVHRPFLPHAPGSLAPPSSVLSGSAAQAIPHLRSHLLCNSDVMLQDMRGALLSQMNQIHSRPISAMLHHVHTGLLLTASRDGTIKLWDALGQLKHVFVGHTREVTSMIVYVATRRVVFVSRDLTSCSFLLGSFHSQTTTYI